MDEGLREGYLRTSTRRSLKARMSKALKGRLRILRAPRLSGLAKEVGGVGERPSPETLRRPRPGRRSCAGSGSGGSPAAKVPPPSARTCLMSLPGMVLLPRWWTTPPDTKTSLRYSGAASLQSKRWTTLPRPSRMRLSPARAGCVAAEPVVLGILDMAGADGVEVDVGGHDPQMQRSVFDEGAAKTPGPEGADALVLPVVPVGEALLEFLHEPRDVVHAALKALADDRVLGGALPSNPCG